MSQAQYLTGPQLVGIAQKAGFPTEQARTYAAINLAESNGAYGNLSDLVAALNGQLAPGSYPGLAYYPQGSPGGGGPEISIGPGQINIIGMNSTDPQKPGFVDPRRLMVDPVYNAQIGFEKSGGGKNFQPWSVFTTKDPQRSYTARLKDVGGQPVTPTNTYSTPDNTTRSDQELAGEGCSTQGCILELPVVGCVFNHCQARAITGGMAMAAGALVMAGGVALLAVYGFQSNAAGLLLKKVGAPNQLVQQRRQSNAASSARDEAAQLAAQRRSVQRSELEDREARVAQRRGDAAARSRSRSAARAGQTLPGEEAF